MSFDFMTNPSPPAPWGLPPTPGWDSSTSCVPLSESTPLHAPDSPLVDNSVTSDLYSIPPTPSSLHSFVAGSPPDSLPDQDSAPFQEILVEPPALGRGHSVKDELRSRIRKRRQDSGLMEITIREEDKKPPERLSKETKISQMDVVRRQKRRESNRRAAAKSRVKKKAEADTLSSELVRLESENADLKGQIHTLEVDFQKLNTILKEHLEVCPLNQPASSCSTEAVHSLVNSPLPQQIIDDIFTIEIEQISC